MVGWLQDPRMTPPISPPLVSKNRQPQLPPLQLQSFPWECVLQVRKKMVQICGGCAGLSHFAAI